MKGREILDQIEKMKYDITQADRLQEYFKNHPEKSEEISEAAGLGTQASALFNTMACSHEARKIALEKALNEAEITI